MLHVRQLFEGQSPQQHRAYIKVTSRSQQSLVAQIQPIKSLNNIRRTQYPSVAHRHRTRRRLDTTVTNALECSRFLGQSQTDSAIIEGDEAANILIGSRQRVTIVSQPRLIVSCQLGIDIAERADRQRSIIQIFIK